MKLLGYIDDILNRFLVPTLEKLPLIVNIILFAIVVGLIVVMYKSKWGKK